MNLTDALEQIATGAAARGGLTEAELAGVLVGARRGRLRVATTVVAGLAGTAAAGLLALSMLHLGDAPAPPVAPTPTIAPSPAPSGSAEPTGTWPSAVTVAALPRCEDPAPVLDAPLDPQLMLTIDAIDGALPADQALNALSTMHTTVGFYGTAAGPITVAVVAREGAWAGKVVAVETGARATSPFGSDSATTRFANPGPVVLTSCVPGLRGRTSDNETVRMEMLPNGTYDLYEVVPLAATTVDDVAYGGQGTLLLAAGPQTLVVGDPMPPAATAPGLPACGQSADGLTPTSLGQISARTLWQRSMENTGFSVALTDGGPATYDRVRFVGLSWAIAQEGVVVHTGTLPGPGQPDLAVLAPGVDAYSTDGAGLDGLTDCRTGGPLDEAVPIEIWTRPVVQLDLTPAFADAADTETSFVASPSWFTYHPVPVPAEVPVVGDGAAAFDGVDWQYSDQVGERVWEVNQSWTDVSTWDRIKGALSAAGYALSEEQTWKAHDYDGINRLTATFRSSRWTIVVSAANDTGGGWLATWQVSAR